MTDGRRWPGEFHSARLLSFYYAAIAADPEFRAFLIALLDRLPIGVLWFDDAIHHDVFAEIVDGAVSQWALRRTLGPRDLWASLEDSARRFRLSPDAKPRLLTVGEGWLEPLDGGTAISAAAPTPFNYDPFSQPESWARDQVKAAVEQVRQDLMERSVPSSSRPNPWAGARFRPGTEEARSWS